MWQHALKTFGLFIIFTSVQGQNEVCHFYHLDADCRYRVDAICLAHITATIDQCSDPISVDFSVTCERPKVRWSHTYASSDSTIQVPGFDMDVQLQVKLSMKPDDVINVEADFHVSGFARRDFINDDIKLRGLEDHCPLLSKAGTIAISVCGGLFAIALALVVVLCIVRRKINQKNAAQSLTSLVEAGEDPGRSTPTRGSRINMEVADFKKPSSDSVLNGDTKQSDGVYTNGFSSTSSTVQNNAITRDTSSTSNGLHSSEVRFSDVLRQDNFDDMEASAV